MFYTNACSLSTVVRLQEGESPWSAERENMRGKLAVALLLLVHPATAHAGGDPAVAALQGTLHARGLYAGPIDGVRGAGTEAAVRAAQRRAGLEVDGIVGPRTRRALKIRPLGSRPLRDGRKGSDVLALQFALAAHGFPCGPFDGGFGARTDAAVRRFQHFAGLAADGIAGGATIAALRLPPPRPPLSLAWPIQGPMTDVFGPRWGRFHAGIDIAAPTGAGVVAAAPGTVVYAGWLAGGWGRLVTIAHGDARTMYAHLSKIEVHVGEEVQAGWEIGRVGATGDATGPHLHFELRVRGAAVDPLPALP
jgi:peptidoglycan hydrolase-like protein with peptidoglycan-binding domain